MSAAADRDLIAVSTAEASRNLGLVAHYAVMVSDALALGNVGIALEAYRSLVLHTRLAGVDVKAIGEIAIAGATEAAGGRRDVSGLSATPQGYAPATRQPDAVRA